MKQVLTAAAFVAASAGAAAAGGIDRSRLSYGLLFEQGTYMEFGFSHVAPKVKGTFAPALGGISTGDMAGDYTTLSFGYKRDLTEQLSLGVYVNTPYGADANYGIGVYNGLNAKWTSNQLAAMLRYEITPSVSVYGGVRYVRSKATINIPDALIRGGLAQAAANPALSDAQRAGAGALAGGAASLAYSAVGETDGKFGYVIGVAYEKPEIALRVGLTYESGFDHKFATTETLPGAGLVNFASTTTVKMPQSIALDFQSGVAKDTLVFGSIRWSEWSVWEVRPAGYNGVLRSDITSFDNNVITYQLGVGRRLNENFSVFARIGYEKENGGVASRLSPTDGSRSIGIGGTYTKDNMKITAGLEYVKVGDAIDSSGTRFTGNKAVGFGMSVGYRF
jgi:long-chain fatty acid transport protein